MPSIVELNVILISITLFRQMEYIEICQQAKCCTHNKLREDKQSTSSQELKRKAAGGSTGLTHHWAAVYDENIVEINTRIINYINIQ